MSHDEKAIRGLIDTFVDGWNAADGAHLASVFSESADFTAITGLHGRGQEVIARGHDEIHLDHLSRDQSLRRSRTH